MGISTFVQQSHFILTNFTNYRLELVLLKLRVKNLFNVADCKMNWQKCGDYLCVKVRLKKIKPFFKLILFFKWTGITRF